MERRPAPRMPRLRASNVEEAKLGVPFSSFMERALYDPEIGYYSSGEVAFGRDRHFETFVTRIQPLFGAMMAEAARDILEAVANHIEDDGELVILELGAGNGDLAFDALMWIDHVADEPRWQAIAPRVRYVIGEFSPALRARQAKKLARFVESGRARVTAVDAREITWEGPFRGVVIANELIDAFSCDQLRIADNGRIERVHIVATGAAGEAPPESWNDAIEAVIGADEAWTRLAASRAGGEPDAIEFHEVGVDLDLGWLQEDGTIAEVPESLRKYLSRIQPLVDDLADLGLLPTNLTWAPGTASFVRNIADLLGGDGSFGGAILVDYGGTSRHLLDPGSLAPHLRVYGPDRNRRNTATALSDAGRYDITWDVDFTDLAHLFADQGLALFGFGQQSRLERPPIDLWSRTSQALLIPRRKAAGASDPMSALLEARELVNRFRNEGYWMIAVGSPGLVLDDETFGPRDRLFEDELLTIDPAYDRETFVEALQAAGLHRGRIDELLHPGGDVVNELAEAWLYSEREAVVGILRDLGWLRP